MKILHTSDWHLGRSLYGRKRYEEFELFLDWLAGIISSETIDALLVAGDIFDTSTPGNRAQELYYRFLCTVAKSCCRHIVIIAGNHDSPSFLNAPKALLRALNVYVTGSVTENPGDEVIVLKNAIGHPEAIVCAVPYLRDKDIRTVEAGETLADKNVKLVEGLQNHYATVCGIAETLQKNFENNNQGKDIPMIAMGHLFTTGGKTVNGDGVRELYVGSLAHVGEDTFPSIIDYLALGHLHVPQCVGNATHIRYSGSPIPMGFGEAKQDKKIVVVCFKGKKAEVKEMPVPCFQALEKITGSLDQILNRIETLKQAESTAWLEIEYTGSEIIGNLRELVDSALDGSALEIRRIRNKQIIDRVISRISEEETLDDLDANDVFERCLDAFEVPCEDRPEMTQGYREILQDLREEDRNAG
jgi:exonuclease SbcD